MLHLVEAKLSLCLPHSGHSMPSSRRVEPASSSGDVRLSRLESLMYRTALSNPGSIMTQDELTAKYKAEALDEQLKAINGLLKKSLFKAQTIGASIQYLAVAKAEASMMGKLDENEGMVYQHINDSRNEGIWTKQLKTRTNLHQTIINRCLKSLEQKQLVKAVKSVKYPTRKIYMLYGLTPSIELSGGPWYTDNELDTGFINELSMACLNYIRSKSFPKNGQSRALFPTSRTWELPSANTVHSYLRNSGLTETELDLEHVISLLDVLVYDELVEKIPYLPFALGAAAGSANDLEAYSDSGSASSSHSDTASDSQSSHSTASDVDGAGERDKRRKRKRSSRGTSTASRKRSKTKSRSKSHGKERRSSRSRSRSRSQSKTFAASSSTSESGSDTDAEDGDGVHGSAKSADFVPFVYRAIRPLSVRVGWTETPCGHCPVFDFCDESGPVNAESCNYYGGRNDELGRTIKHGWIDTTVDDDDNDNADDQPDAHEANTHEPDETQGPEQDYTLIDDD